MAPSEMSLHSASPRTARSHSISSDRPSLTGYGGLLSPPLATTPEPAFIAASAASQIVTNDHDSKAESWFDQHGIEPSGETAMVSVPALALVNRFLDQILFNFLSLSKSTALASLRPAVAEVLKPKLAKDAISGADQELHEYLGDGEDEDLMALHNGLEPSGDWDLELVWKRTRLRCMVYSSLGDMEEEDEDLYTEQEHLEGPPGNRFSVTSGVVSPAVAIFLTSILEFMGEQVLVVAGQAAYHRLRSRLEKEEKDGETDTGEEIADRVVVTDADMERVALDRTLGRLWRGWKKRIRSPTTSVSMVRSFSRESMRSQARASRNGSIAPDEDATRPSIEAVAAMSIHEYAAGIPLPITDDDVREIEIPGVAKEINDDEAGTEFKEEAPMEKSRPKSLVILTSQNGQALLTPASSQPQTPIFATSRKRSHSLPSPAISLLPTPSPKRTKTDQDTASEGSEMAEKSASLETPVEEGAANAEDLVVGEVPAEPVMAKDADIAEGMPREPSEKFKDVDSPAEHVVGDAITDTPTEPVETKEHQSISETAHAGTEESHESKGLVAGALAGAVAFGAAAVAGITAAATGQAPQTEPVHKEENDEEEEPRIMTSSRVSISGRGSPDGGKAPSRQASGRANSVHSVRLIDVASPTHSRHGSVDASDFVGGRPVLGSRPGSIHSPLETPRVASPISRSANTSPLARASSQPSVKHKGHSTEASISEEKEAIDSDTEQLTAVPTDIATAMHGVNMVDSPTSEQFVTRSDTRSQPTAFTLSAPPGARNGRDSKKGLVNDQQPPQQSSSLGVMSRTLGVENGVPPLTPLREMMEGAPDTSDEASSIAPSNDAQSLSEYGHSPSVSASSLANVVNQQPRSVRPQTASAHRSSPPRSSREEPKKSQQANHTASGSSSSSHKLRPVRTSEDEPPKSPGQNTGQSFEQLIRSDQTIQYTLTPQNMRNIEGAPESPRFATTPVIINSQDGPRPPTGRSHSSSVSKFTGLHSNPPAETPKSKSAKITTSSPLALDSPISPISSNFMNGKVPKSAPPPTANTGARLRPNAPQPRDARVDRESMGDLAEFISSTAPPGSYEAPLPARTTSAFGQSSVTGSLRNGSVSRASTAASVPRRSASSAQKNRLQARDAAVSRGDSISDLIDFVRSGPQLDTHRIPRTVAPFRTTMDSDQMSGAVAGRAVDASLPDPRFSQASVSMNGSINSQSALLANASKTYKPRPGQKLNNLDDEDMIPKRKTRKVRDMYQIDFSDEEEEYDTFTSSRPKPIKEESLAEFLANVPPPPDSSPAPIYDAAYVKASNIKKKTSSPSLMSRFGRKDSFPSAPPKPMSSGQESRTSSRTSSRAPQLPLHSPIAVQFTSSNKPSTYEPARGTGNSYVSRLDSARSKVSQSSYQPREAFLTDNGTNDLANFLRSDPPSNLAIQPQTFTPTLHKEEASAFQRMFGRKKAH